jgi:putative ABC transport system substrate-binding protein
MKRREFITLLGGATAWPLAAGAQQPDRVRRIGVLMPYDENDRLAKAQMSGFTKGLSELGWTDSRNLQMEIRWAAAGDVDRVRTFAKELVDLQPDLIFAESTPQIAALQRDTRTIPIVFVLVADPIGSGFMESLARPGGNITGFTHLDPAMVGKWVELLMEIAPGVKQVAAMFNPDTAPYVTPYYLRPFEAAAQSFKITPITTPVHNDAEIETVITSLRREAKGGLVVMPDSFMAAHRAPIISLAARNNVPAVYWNSDIARDGGLLSYGADVKDIYHRAASYVDRILRGENPANLPVQLPTKFEMVVNVKTATAIGLTISESFLIRADQVIE